MRDSKSLPTQLHGDVILKPHLFKISLEQYNQTRFNNFKSQARSFQSPFILLPISPLTGRPLRILRREHGIIENSVHTPIPPQRFPRTVPRLHDDEDSISNFNFN